MTMHLDCDHYDLEMDLEWREIPPGPCTHITASN